MPYTLELTAAATFIGLLLGIPLGVVAATQRGRFADGVSRAMALLGFTVPDFYLGALLLIVFALDLGLFPVNGAGDGLLDQLYHLVLPALTLGVVKAAFMSRLTRSALLDVLGQNYVRTARAKGLRSRLVIYRHALRNALLPVATGLSVSILSTLSGSVAIELIFGRPGLGSLLINGIETRDYPVVQAALVVVRAARGPGQSCDGLAVRVDRPAAAHPVKPSSTIGAAVILLLCAIAVFAPLIAPDDPLAQSVLSANLPPDAAHWFGTDQFGRDVFSRVLYGTRSSLLLGTISPLAAAAVGCALGVVAGYFGGLTDRLLGRLIDLLLCFPELLLGILVAAALGPGFWELVAALGRRLRAPLRPHRPRLHARRSPRALHRGEPRDRAQPCRHHPPATCCPTSRAPSWWC